VRAGEYRLNTIHDVPGDLSRDWEQARELSAP
jgi:hypothetical protein